MRVSRAEVEGLAVAVDFTELVDEADEISVDTGVPLGVTVAVATRVPRDETVESKVLLGVIDSVPVNILVIVAERVTTGLADELTVSVPKSLRVTEDELDTENVGTDEKE